MVRGTLLFCLFKYFPYGGLQRRFIQIATACQARGAVIHVLTFEWEGAIRDLTTCEQACKDIDIVFHQAALGSIPRSVSDPLTTHHVNSTGMLNMLMAAKTHLIQRFVYAASSSTYGDHPALPKQEEHIGHPLSPYAVTKANNEQYARVFNTCYQLPTIGLRYFNIFGPRQDPNSQYAAVIPKFIQSLLAHKAPIIFGDGEQSRDFTAIENAIHANLCAMDAPETAFGEVFNVACGEQTTLNTLYEELSKHLNVQIPAEYGPTRTGDVKHSLANIQKAKTYLGYTPLINVQTGLASLANFALTQRNHPHQGN